MIKEENAVQCTAFLLGVFIILILVLILRAVFILILISVTVLALVLIVVLILLILHGFHPFFPFEIRIGQRDEKYSRQQIFLLHFIGNSAQNGKTVYTEYEMQYEINDPNEVCFFQKPDIGHASCGTDCGKDHKSKNLASQGLMHKIRFSGGRVFGGKSGMKIDDLLKNGEK